MIQSDMEKKKRRAFKRYIKTEWSETEILFSHWPRDFFPPSRFSLQKGGSLLPPGSVSSRGLQRKFEIVTPQFSFPISPQFTFQQAQAKRTQRCFWSLFTLFVFSLQGEGYTYICGCSAVWGPEDYSQKILNYVPITKILTCHTSLERLPLLPLFNERERHHEIKRDNKKPALFRLHLHANLRLARELKAVPSVQPFSLCRWIVGCIVGWL